jgi:ribosomal-protein-alanine N-acetyltransferase
VCDLENLTDPRVRRARSADADRLRALQTHLRQPSADLLEYGLAVGAGFASVARGLLAAVVRDADGPVTLQAHPENDAALALYEQCGFAVTERRPDAYADGDALVLRRE